LFVRIVSKKYKARQSKTTNPQATKATKIKTEKKETTFFIK